VTIDSRSVVVASASQTSCELHGETVILDFDKGAYFGLDEIGTLIWQLLQQPRPVRALCDAVVEQYEVEPAVCELDVVRLLERLHAEGLIDIRNPTA
jgi:hypothetical protein